MVAERPTKHRRRFHTDRIVRSRRQRYVRETPSYALGDPVRLSYGRLSDRDPWDCGSHCEMCHWSKFNDARRAREKREWIRDVA